MFYAVNPDFVIIAYMVHAYPIDCTLSLDILRPAQTEVNMPMTLAELTAAMHAFVRAKGWYETDSLRPQSLRSLAISLSLEAAEVLEHFQWRDIAAGDLDDPTRQALAAELADVALYLLQIASLGGIDLEQAILDKLDVNYGRTWDQR